MLRTFSPSPVSCADILPRWGREEQSGLSVTAVGADALGGPCTPRHIRPERFGEFAACTNSPVLFSCLSPVPPGRPEAVPYGGDGVRCEYPWRCMNPTPRRRDPSSAAPPQDDNTGCRSVPPQWERLASPGCPPCLKGGAPVLTLGRGDTSFVSAVGVANVAPSPSLPPAGEGGSRRSPARRLTDEGEAETIAEDPLFSPSPVSCADILPRRGRNRPLRHHRKRWRHLPLRGEAFVLPAPAEGVAFGRFLYHPFDQATRRSAARGPHPALRATFPVRGEGDGRTTEDPAAWKPPGRKICGSGRLAYQVMRCPERGPSPITPRPGPAWPRRSSGSRPHWRPASDRPACRTPRRRRSRPCRCSS